MTTARERWNRRYLESAGAARPAELLSEIEGVLPASGSMVDVAGGSGRNAIWFAQRGFAVTVVDVSVEGLAHARQRAAAAGVEVECIERDLEAEGVPAGRTWDVALMHLFSNRAVLRSLPGSLNPGGLLVFSQPTVVNLECHERPSRQFLLAPGEIAAIADDLDGMEVIEVSEGWRSSGRHEARLIARRLGP